MKAAKKSSGNPIDYRLSADVTESFLERVGTLISANATEPLFSYADGLWLSKYEEAGDSKSPEHRRAAAIEKWLQTELNNEVTNRRLADRSLDRNIIFGSVTVGEFFSKVTSLVNGLLPSPVLSCIEGGFSGGATTSKTRKVGHPSIKFRDEADATPDALGLFLSVMKGTAWASHFYRRWKPSLVEGNILFTVPKNNQIDRVACKEPDINIFLQKMLGDQIRRALRRTGIDLNDQTVNQRLAREGSESGDLATIDLSAASDSVTLGLVSRVMPSKWFDLLDCVRSTRTRIDDTWHENQMFSSMGNGFTFELESLLFLVIARAVRWFHRTSGRISVYGDDIICPTSLVDDLEEALMYCGFRLNRTKTFVEGPIRESCGAHWYNGISITPFFFRRRLVTVSDLILSMNLLIRWGSQELPGVVDPRVEEVWRDFLGYVPKKLWGGQDLASRYTLVTGHRPRFRLNPAVEVKKQAHIGGLIYWLHTAEKLGAKRSAITVSQETAPSGCLFRVVKNDQPVNTGVPAFHGWQALSPEPAL